MNDMRNYSPQQREAKLKAIAKDFEALEKKHGADVVRWAINKLTAQRRERRKLEAERADAEAKLAELNRKAAAA